MIRGIAGRSLRTASAFLISGALLAGAALTAYAQAQTFNVTLDGNNSPFVIGGAPTQVRAAAPLTFAARNVGPAGDTSPRHTHNLAIEGPNGQTIQSPVPNLTGGQSANITFAALPAGNYVLYCPVGQHRNNGMSVNFTVVAGASALPATGGYVVPVGLAISGLVTGAAGFVLRRRQA
ncbi:MAG TPA: sulfocyanin-like copper-binding protein [Chloroflexota bacterium]|nr:sulfocyanin-like copper-binding protein [Chloroflexota bacterium]